MSLTIDGEEIVRASDLQRGYAAILERAADHAVSIQRDSDKVAITLISRTSWQRSSQALRFQATLMQLSLTLAARLAGDRNKPFPSELAWLNAFDDADLAEFVLELTETLQAVHAGLREASEIDAILYEWHRSALVSRDRALQQQLKSTRVRGNVIVIGAGGHVKEDVGGALDQLVERRREGFDRIASPEVPGVKIAKRSKKKR